MIDLVGVKKRKDLLLAELKQTQDGKSLHCPLHDDAHGSLWIIQSDSGDWIWRCEGCGLPERGAGTLIDAIQLVRSLSSSKAAIRALAEDLGQPIREPAPPPPVINVDRAEAIVQKAHKNLMESFDLQERMLVARRGITDMDLVESVRLGFLTDQAFQGWSSWRLTCWVLPITDASGKLCAVKLHNEFRAKPEIPKCLWAPLSPSGKHSFPTLWPPPERFPDASLMVVAPGELKALAFISEGYASTSPTFAEGKAIPEALLSRIKAKSVAFCYDGEADKKRPDGTIFNPGRQWRDRCYPIAAACGLEVVSFTYNHELRKPDPLPKQTIEVDVLESEWQRPAMSAAELDEMNLLRAELGGQGQWLKQGLSLDELRQLRAFEQATKRAACPSYSADINSRDFARR
ncbi:MAG TPA: hypothetical protein VMX75_14745 [Spirochaetia bacterium]|nr:hypothetical protein [Spirochaetia bacterium]